MEVVTFLYNIVNREENREWNVLLWEFLAYLVRKNAFVSFCYGGKPDMSVAPENNSYTT